MLTVLVVGIFWMPAATSRALSAAFAIASAAFAAQPNPGTLASVDSIDDHMSRMLAMPPTMNLKAGWRALFQSQVPALPTASKPFFMPSKAGLTTPSHMAEAPDLTALQTPSTIFRKVSDFLYARTRP